MSSDDGDEVITIINVIDSIGIEIYKYLYPQELFKFSLSSQHIYHGISKGIIQACLRQMPPNFGSCGVDHCVSINNRHSFYKKDDVLEYLLDKKIRVAELKLVETETLSLEESIDKARQVLSNKKSGAKFISYSNINDMSLPVHIRNEAEYINAGYHFEKDNKELATERCKYILSRLLEGEELIISKHIPIIKTWINYILSQKHIIAGTWFWSCRHRLLDFQGVEGKGVTISSPSVVGEEMEISWMRMTASRV